jgi:DivIVA domain-containing protein
VSTDTADGNGVPGPAAGTGSVTAYRLPRHLSPEQVRGASFERAPFGRRGFEESEVLDYLDRVAEELAARDVEIARLESENRQLKHALREWHRQLVGYDSAEIIARTQQHIEAQIAQAEQYSREREEEATQRYEEILAEARRRAQDEAERLVSAARAGGAAGGAVAPGADGGGGGAEADRLAAAEWLGRQQTYVGALQQALGSLAAQVDATRQAFGVEVERLAELTSGRPAPTRAGALGPGPTTDERNGHGRGGQGNGRGTRRRSATPTRDHVPDPDAEIDPDEALLPHRHTEEPPLEPLVDPDPGLGPDLHPDA